MTGKKAFWISAAITALAVLPIFAIAGLYAMTRVQETDTAVKGISVNAPTSADIKTVLIMTGSGSAQTANTAVIVHLDALHSRLSCIAMPMETVVLANGTPTTLSLAAASAGPSQCAAAISETLGITVDNYIYTTPQTLCDMVQGLGNASIKLSRYVPSDELSKLMLVIDGIDTQVLSPSMLAEVLSACSGSPNVQQLRADGYLAFLTADPTLLQSAITASLKKYSGSLATDINAQAIYDYDRIFKFFGREAPTQTESAILPGKTTANGIYELLPQAEETAQRLCVYNEK